MATTVAFSDLDTWLQNQPINTVSTPYELKITELTESNISYSDNPNTIGYILNQNPNKYVDLRETKIPNTVTSMNSCFQNCVSLVYAPIIPETVHSRMSNFSGCTALKAVTYARFETDSGYEFSGCTSLKTITIKEVVESQYDPCYGIESPFYGCSALEGFCTDTPFLLKDYLTTIKNLSSSSLPQNVSYYNISLCSDPAEISIYNLANDLMALSPNTTSTPYKIKITGLTITGTTGIFYIREKLRANSTKYVDLSATPFPNDGVTRDNLSLYGAFKDCSTLIKSPSIVPEVDYIKVKDLEDCYSGCTNLIESPVIPNTVTNISGAFENCSSLQTIEVPNSVMSLYGAFKGCTSLTSFSIKNFDASKIVNHTQTFYGCANLVNFYCDTPYDLKYWLSSLSSNDFPNSISSCHFYLFSESVEMSILHSEFGNNLATLDANTVQTPFKIKVTDLTVQNVGSSAQGGSSGTLGSFLLANPTKYVDLSETIMPNATDLTSTFENCATLVDSPGLPSTVTDLDSTYKGCTNLAEAPAIPNTVTEMPNTFTGCSSIETVEYVPSGVTDLTECFKNCSALEEIEQFDVPLSVLKTNAQDCFSGCTSLTTVGVEGVAPITEADYWHVMRLNFGNNVVSGKVYDTNKNATTIPQTTIVKDTLTLPIKTDEMWFPPVNLNDEQVDAVIENVIDTKRTYFNKDVISPNNKSFVLWKDSHSNFVSNIDFGGGGGSSITVYPTEEDIIEDLPNLNDGDIVASYGDGEQFNDAPLGTIAAYYGTTDPTNGKWLICDGRDTTGTTIELETHYPSLYLFLGGTNVLPDLRNKALMGANDDSTLGNLSDVGDIQDAQLPNVVGTFRAQGWGSGSSGNVSGAMTLTGRGNIDSGTSEASNYPKDWSFDSSNANASTDHLGNNVYTAGGETRPANVRCNWIIKATTTAETRPLPSEGIAEIESYTTSLIASKLGNLLQVDHIWSTPITVASTTLTRTLDGYHFNDYDFIISEVSFYSDAQHNFMPIPKSSVQSSYGTGADFFIQGASTGGTDRRIGFTIDSDTTFRITMLNGTSGNMPKFQGFYGIKFNLT